MAKAGIIWEQAYTTWTPLWNTKSQASNFVTKIVAKESDRRRHGDTTSAVVGITTLAASLADLTESGTSPFEFAETVDILYFSGHGNPNGPVFLTGMQASPGLVRWGNGGLLKWVVLDACDVLGGADPRTRWQGVFQKLHALFGFSTQATDETIRGREFATFMTRAPAVAPAVAWQWACQETEGWSAAYGSGAVDPGATTRWAYLYATSALDERWSAPLAVTAAPSLTYVDGPC